MRQTKMLSSCLPFYRHFGFCIAALSGTLFLALSANAQTAPAAPSAPAVHSKAPRRKHAAKKHAKQKSVAPAVVAPPPPPPPLPPVQQAPRPASVTFAQGQLSVRAQNSSLAEILGQISRRTGLEVEGLKQDERIYGQFGPDTVARTLTQLMDGSGYNYVLIAGTSDTPGKLVLTPANDGSGSPAPNATGIAAPLSVAGGAVSPGTQQPADAASGGDPARPKTPQEMFDELRKMHPQ
ncbi:MAG: hypothetical protein ACYDC6_09965 [Acidobacteriaceae bacterium]